MAQIHGSGTGNWKNTAVVDDNGRLFTRSLISDGTDDATVTPEGYLDVKTHTPDYCFSKEFAEAQNNVAILTPTTGKKIRIIQVYTASKSDDDVRIFFANGDIENIFVLYPTKKSSALGAVICGTGDIDEPVKLTCGGDTFVQFGYDEV